MTLELDLDKLSEGLRKKLFDLLVSRFEEVHKEYSKVSVKVDEILRRMGPNDYFIEHPELGELLEENKSILEENYELDDILKDFNTYLSYKSKNKE